MRVKSPKMPKVTATKTDPIVPLPDMSGAAVMQSKFDALRNALGKRGRSSTLLTWGKKKGSNGSITMSGKLADVEGGRAQQTVLRG